MIVYPHAQAPWQEQERFADPISTPEDLQRVLALLAGRLAARLEAGWLGAHGYTARFRLVDGQEARIGIATAHPLRDAGRVARLLGEKLEQVDPGFGIETALLQAEAVAPLQAVQPTLDSARFLPQMALSELMDQLGNRLGGGMLWRDAPRASHVPERSVQPAPIVVPVMAWQMIDARPVRLLAQPEPVDVMAALPDDPPAQFRWRGALHRVRSASLPERIGAEWWRRAPDESRMEQDRLRDYYRVEDNQGARFWLFRIGLDAGVPGQRWFLHGIFG